MESLVTDSDESTTDESDVDSTAGDEAEADEADAAEETRPTPAVGQCASKCGCPKLWTNAQFPEGCVPIAANWDLANLSAAQEWECPCPDRRNCIGAGRGISLLQLYEHRKNFLTTCKFKGGKRDAWRADMSAHYSSSTGSLTRSFVVGPLNDCCAASAGLAKGLSFQTFANARADLRKERPLKQGRKRRQTQGQSYARSMLHAYIRTLRSTFEGSKSKEVQRWHTGKRSVPKRWEDYKKHRAGKGLPIVGSLNLFREVWKEHTEIKEAGATGHSICEDCGATQAVYDRYEGRTDPAAIAAREAADAKQAQHDVEHRGERAYAEDIWAKAELQPDLITAMNMDAPTVSQFDIPVQKRAARDVTKRLETMQKWGSKVTGVMLAGWGMVCWLARAGLGSGPNLSLTLMYLSLHELARTARGLGSRFNLLMDNTAGDNKHAEMILFLGWLVLNDVFEDASFFCMLKGHTFTVLDQSFNTLISQLLGEAIYSMSSLCSFIFKFLQPYGCSEVREVHQLWDWCAFFKPHANRMAGFCTSQFGAGMHECYIRKDRHGEPTHTHVLCLTCTILHFLTLITSTLSSSRSSSV